MALQGPSGLGGHLWEPVPWARTPLCGAAGCRPSMPGDMLTCGRATHARTAPSLSVTPWGRGAPSPTRKGPACPPACPRWLHRGTGLLHTRHGRAESARRQRRAPCHSCATNGLGTQLGGKEVFFKAEKP